MKIVKFYTLSDPRTPDIIRYLGKTSQEKIQRRLDQHVCDAKRAQKRKIKSNHNYNWIQSLLKDGLKPLIIEIDRIEVSKESKEWVILEKYWISQLKTWGFKLTNLTDGGDGNQNQVVSKETIEKRAAQIRGIPRDEETRKRISESHKGKIKTEEHIENIRKSIIKKQGRKIRQYTLKGEYIRSWNSIAEAADHYKVDRSSVMRCCQGKFKKSAGFIWKYIDEDIV